MGFWKKMAISAAIGAALSAMAEKQKILEQCIKETTFMQIWEVSSEYILGLYRIDRSPGGIICWIRLQKGDWYSIETSKKKILDNHSKEYNGGYTVEIPKEIHWDGEDKPYFGFEGLWYYIDIENVTPKGFEPESYWARETHSLGKINAPGKIIKNTTFMQEWKKSHSLRLCNDSIEAGPEDTIVLCRVDKTSCGIICWIRLLIARDLYSVEIPKEIYWDDRDKPFFVFGYFYYYIDIENVTPKCFEPEIYWARDSEGARKRLEELDRKKFIYDPQKRNERK